MALIAVTAVCCQVCAAVLSRHRAEVGADLGALAGAAAVLAGESSACARASEVARANETTVTACTVDGADLLLTVTAPVRIGPLVASATGRARAGPVDLPTG